MATRSERLKDFTVQGTPPSDLPMELLCEDNSGTYVLPFACRWSDGAWNNCAADIAIEGEVVGWRSWKRIE